MAEHTCRECGRPVAPLRVLDDVEVVPPLCPGCAAAAADADDETERERTLARALDAAGATPRLLRYTLGSHPDAAAVLVARAWLDGERRNLWLQGPVGVGKTALAWGIVRELAEREVAAFYALPRHDRDLEPRHPALFLIWADLLDDLRAAMDARRRAERTGEDADPAFLFERARRVPVLALDDLGRERPTPYALERLASLVEHRYQREIPTIVTSNYGIRELAARLAQEAERVVAERIVSRLLEGATVSRFEGPSHRRAA